MEDQTDQTQPSPEANVPVAPEETNVPVAQTNASVVPPEDAAAEELTGTNPRVTLSDGMQLGDTVRIRGGGAGYISQISALGDQVRVAEPIPDDQHGRVSKRWVPAADVELSE